MSNLAKGAAADFLEVEKVVAEGALRQPLPNVGGTGLVFGVWRLVLGGWCFVFGVWCLAFDVWCLVFGVWCVVCDVWCVALGVWCLVFGVWCFVSRFRVQGSGFRVQGSGFRVQGSESVQRWIIVEMIGGGLILGFRDQDLGFMIYDFWFVVNKKGSFRCFGI